MTDRDGRAAALYALDTAPLRPVVDWIAALGRPGGWEQRMDALETEVRRTRRDRREAAA